MDDSCIATPPPTDSSHNTQRNKVDVQCAPLAQTVKLATVVYASHTCACQADDTADCQGREWDLVKIGLWSLTNPPSLYSNPSNSTTRRPTSNWPTVSISSHLTNLRWHSADTPHATNPDPSTAHSMKVMQSQHSQEIAAHEQKAGFGRIPVEAETYSGNTNICTWRSLSITSTTYGPTCSA